MDQKNKDDKKSKNTFFLGLALGLGAAFGMMLDRLGLGLALGIAIGLGIDAIRGNKKDG